MEVKITTLSLSARISEFPEILLCGFPGCVAPEVIERIGYGPEADIFSCGIIMYMITTGIFPFSALTINEILEKNRQCKINFSKDFTELISAKGIDLMKQMTAKDPSIRPSAKDCLIHPWFAEHCSKKSLGSTLHNLKNLSK